MYWSYTLFVIGVGFWESETRCWHAWHVDAVTLPSYRG